MTLTATITAMFAKEARHSDAAIALSCLDALSKHLEETPAQDYRDMVAALVLIVMGRFDAIKQCVATAPGADQFLLPSMLAFPLGANEERVLGLYNALREASAAARQANAVSQNQ